MKTFEEIIEKVLAHEGGYVNDPKDLGGETKYGITKRFYPEADIKNLTNCLVILGLVIVIAIMFFKPNNNCEKYEECKYSYIDESGQSQCCKYPYIDDESGQWQCCFNKENYYYNTHYQAKCCDGLSYKNLLTDVVNTKCCNNTLFIDTDGSRKCCELNSNNTRCTYISSIDELHL